MCSISYHIMLFFFLSRRSVVIPPHTVSVCVFPFFFFNQREDHRRLVEVHGVLSLALDKPPPYILLSCRFHFGTVVRFWYAFILVLGRHHQPVLCYLFGGLSQMLQNWYLQAGLSKMTPYFLGRCQSDACRTKKAAPGRMLRMLARRQ